MPNFLRVSPALLLIALLFGISAGGWPWSHDMETQPSPPPYAGPRPPAEAHSRLRENFH